MTTQESIMSESCDICSEAFSELERVPKILDCGHTFCSVCLSASVYCPTCGDGFTKDINDYPTNFKVLNLKKVATEKSYPVSHIAKSYPASHIADSLKKMKELYVLRREIMIKKMREITDLKIIIANDLTKIQQMLEMDPDVMNSTDEEIIVGLEENLAKVDEVLFCCGKMDIEPTYLLSEYINKACFLFDLVNRLHKEEEIYVYGRVDGKPKYGRVSLSKDVINFHVLDLPKVDKLASVVSLQDVRKCVRKDNLQTFIKIMNETLCFSIESLSFLAFMFIKLCTGETGCKIKGVNASFLWKQVQVQSNVYNRGYNAQMHSEFQHMLIEKFMLNDVEVASLDDYQFTIFAAENNETKFSEGDFVLQMLENGVYNLIKLSNTTGLTCKNALAKMVGSLFPAGLQNIQTGEITDSGISLMYSKIP